MVGMGVCSLLSSTLLEVGHLNFGHNYDDIE